MHLEKSLEEEPNFQRKIPEKEGAIQRAFRFGKMVSERFEKSTAGGQLLVLQRRVQFLD